ncbi:hypothetical protein WME94_20565 [Sorangium sp. So ce429]
MKKAILFVSALIAGLITADQQAAASGPNDFATCARSGDFVRCSGTFNGFSHHTSSNTFARFYTYVSASGVPSYFFQANIGGVSYACEANATLAAHWEEFMAANGEFYVSWYDSGGGDCHRISIWKSSNQARLN